MNWPGEDMAARSSISHLIIDRRELGLNLSCRQPHLLKPSGAARKHGRDFDHITRLDLEHTGLGRIIVTKRNCGGARDEFVGRRELCINTPESDQSERE